VIGTLVVDDDYRVAAVHGEYVGQVPGFNLVGTARSGQEAIELVDRLSPDLVLLDFYLPDMSGLEVLRRLREDSHHPVDVIAITAARDVFSLREAIRGGVVHYLVKPFRLSALEEKLLSFASARARLARMEQADQVQVDRVFGALRSTAAEGLPKRLSDTTLELVLTTLSDSGADLAAADVARAAGLSRVTARRYLEYLCQTGRAEISLRYGSPGRPEHRYRLLRGHRAG
jgi:two-component system CitB family response regulator